MSIEASVYSLLSPLVGARVYPDIAPNGAERPFITYQQIGGQALNPLSNAPPGKHNALMQINVWADTRLQASTLALEVEDAMRTADQFAARPQMAFISTYEPDTKLYGAIQDFSIWSDR